eukprot:1523996-Rhodomonas_salina.1
MMREGERLRRRLFWTRGVCDKAKRLSSSAFPATRIQSDECASGSTCFDIRREGGVRLMASLGSGSHDSERDSTACDAIRYQVVLA